MLAASDTNFPLQTGRVHDRGAAFAWREDRHKFLASHRFALPRNHDGIRQNASRWIPLFLVRCPSRRNRPSCWRRSRRCAAAARDFLILAAFCLALFGYEMFSGRALSLHEARLAELSREMFANHNWLFPQSGGRPWLERPPLPQWIEVGTSLLLGQRCDAVWVVRLPSV